MKWLLSLCVLLFGVASSLAETPSLEEQALALSEAAIGNISKFEVAIIILHLNWNVFAPT